MAEAFVTDWTPKYFLHVCAVAGRLIYEPRRPVRQCAQQQQQAVANNSAVAGMQGDGPEQLGVASRAAESQQQPEGFGEPAAAAASISGQAANKQQLLSDALAAVAELAMCEDAPTTDAAFAVAWSCIAGLLKGTGSASGSAAAAGVKQDLQKLYMAVAAGEAAQPTALQQLMGQLRKLASSGNVGSLAASSSGEPAAVPLAVPRVAAKQLHCENAVPVSIDAELPAPPNGLVNSSSSSSKRAAGALGGRSSGSKRFKGTAAENRAPPDWADSRPGRWVDEEYYVQLGDVVFMQVDGSCDRDPCTFFVPRNNSSSIGSSAGSSVGAAAARAWVFRVESFGGASGQDSSMMARFYYNTQRDLQQPLLFKRKSERLVLSKVQGIVHTLMPSSVNEVLQLLDAQLVEEVVEAVWQKVDTE
jgi:hypothetical protein